MLTVQGYDTDSGDDVAFLQIAFCSGAVKTAPATRKRPAALAGYIYWRDSNPLSLFPFGEHLNRFIELWVPAGFDIFIG